MKYIRELRMGPPKSFKTGATVGSYPKPMLVFLFDKEGLDIIPSKPTPGFDIVHSDMVEITPSELVTYCKKKPEELPKVTYIAFYKLDKSEMTFEFVPYATDNAYREFVNCVNYITKLGMPWKTYVLDSITTLCDSMMSSVSKNNTSMLSDPRKWSPAVGGKVLQHIAVLNNLLCNCVYIAHSHIDKDESTGAISTLPLGPNRFSEQCGSLVSQYLYASTEDGTAKVWTRPKGSVKAVGCRWPIDIPAICGADYKSIYGKEV